MKKYIAIYKDNWADEMDIEGFRFFNEAQKEVFLNDAASCFGENGKGEYTWYCGTNEEIEFSCLSDALRHIKFKEISDNEEERLKSLFGTSFGHFPYFEVDEWDA